MHELYELKEKLMRELEEYGQQEMSAGNLQVIDTLSHSIKNLCKIIEAYEMEEGQSMRGGNRNSYERGGGNRYSREGGNSREGGRYSREDGSYARRGRDSMGRYTGAYARTGGVEELVESLRGMMGELPQELQQDAQRFVQKLEQQM